MSARGACALAGTPGQAPPRARTRAAPRAFMDIMAEDLARGSVRTHRDVVVCVHLLEGDGVLLGVERGRGRAAPALLRVLGDRHLAHVRVAEGLPPHAQQQVNARGG
jgi:hypothetical protein